MEYVRKVYNFVAPKAEKEDGRDVWPSRLAFVLAAMGGAVGLGNLLRFPSVVFENNGLQWFLPYFISLILLAIPLLVLEISLGQAARGGGVIAFHQMDKYAKGVGLGTITTGYMVATYYVAILSWAMVYFRSAFVSPLPWEGRSEAFYEDDVLRNIDPIPGSYSEDGKTVTSYAQYPGTGMVGETVGWCAFIWFILFICIFRGVGLSGRVVYITMGLPIIIIFILLGRGVSMDNAVEGIKMYMGHWDSSKLASGAIWQAAAGQIFFSTGVGFGYFTTFASYNSKFANAVQDAVIIGCSNSLYEILAGFAVFGVIGYLGLKPEEGDELGTFTVGFLTYPEAVSAMPGANFWGVLFFITIVLVGISSAFALVESLITMVADSEIGKRVSRSIITMVVMTISFLLSLMYSTQFGFHMLGAIDTWLNNLALLFIAWAECVFTTTMYRHKDVIGQVGLLSFVIYNLGYFLGNFLGIAVGHAVMPEAGAGVGFGLYIAGVIGSVLLAKSPDTPAPRFWGNREGLSRFWWLAFYSGHQLAKDLNVVIAQGSNWAIPVFWGPIVRYISAPILAIIVGFSYPDFYIQRNDPLQIFGFTCAHVVMLIVVVGLTMPSAFNILLPSARRDLGDRMYAPRTTMPLLPEDPNIEQGSDYQVEGKPVGQEEAFEHTEKPLQ